MMNSDSGEAPLRGPTPRKDTAAEAFGHRFRSALESNPYVKQGWGQQRWIRDELQKRHNVDVSYETISKWIRGMILPTNENGEGLAKLLGVDFAWLIHGLNSAVPQPQLGARQRNAEAAGVTNLVAGLIQMDGGTVSFPESVKGGVNLEAIIRGAGYRFCVIMGQHDPDGAARFFVPRTAEEVIVLGVLRADEAFAFEILEIEQELVLKSGHFNLGSIECAIPADVLCDMDRITTFTKRL